MYSIHGYVGKLLLVLCLRKLIPVECRGHFSLRRNFCCTRFCQLLLIQLFVASEGKCVSLASIERKSYNSSPFAIWHLKGQCGQHHAPAALPPEKTRLLLYRRLGVSRGRSGRHVKPHPTGIRSPDRPAHNESLYRLPSRGHHYHVRLLCV